MPFRREVESPNEPMSFRGASLLGGGCDWFARGATHFESGQAERIDREHSTVW
jgi:hypothetical protein